MCGTEGQVLFKLLESDVPVSQATGICYLSASVSNAVRVVMFPYGKDIGYVNPILCIYFG